MAIEPALPLLKTLDFGYDLARMLYEIVLAPEAVDDLRRMRANDRATVRAAIEQFLRHNPASVSRSRIKRLRGLSRPQYRLRVGDFRIFYDIDEQTVEILAIVPKSVANEWLEQVGESDEGSGAS